MKVYLLDIVLGMITILANHGTTVVRWRELPKYYNVDSVRRAVSLILIGNRRTGLQVESNLQ